MSDSDANDVKQMLVDAGFEVYRTVGAEIHLAERVRYHIMDAGVRVDVDTPLRIRFVARSQRSDFPNADADTLFDRVRDTAGRDAGERGYAEALHETVEIKDPVDPARILDVWHEITYEKPTALTDLVDEVRWALGVDKYVTICS